MGPLSQFLSSTDESAINGMVDGWFSSASSTPSTSSTSFIDTRVDLPRHNLQILPDPPAAAAFQYLKIARQGFDQVRSSHAAVQRASEEASKWAAVAKQAAQMSQHQQSMKDAAAAAAVSFYGKSLFLRNSPDLPDPSGLQDSKSSFFRRKSLRFHKELPRPLPDPPQTSRTPNPWFFMRNPCVFVKKIPKLKLTSSDPSPPDVFRSSFFHRKSAGFHKEISRPPGSLRSP